MNPKRGTTTTGNVQTRNQSTLTDDLYYRDTETTTRAEMMDVATKTVAAGVDPMDDDEYYSDDEGIHRPPPEFNMDALADWLTGMYPRIKAELQAGTDQRAFDNYEVKWEEERGEINELHQVLTDFDFVSANKAVLETLQLMKDTESENASTHVGASNFDDWDDGPSSKASAASKRTQSKTSVAGSEQLVAGLDKDFQVTSLSWNCKGSCVAVAYGKTDHVTWCEHQSVVSIFYPFRRDFDPHKPSTNIEVSNCMNEVTFHPADPLLLAGGTHNGEIFLWNIDQEDPKLCSSEIDEYHHREQITRLIWVRQESLTTL